MSGDEDAVTYIMGWLSRTKGIASVMFLPRFKLRLGDARQVCVSVGGALMEPRTAQDFKDMVQATTVSGERGDKLARLRVLLQWSGQVLAV